MEPGPLLKQAAADYRDEKKVAYLLKEVFVQRQIATVHLRALHEALALGDDTKAWASAQGFLGAASIVSLCLWPTDQAQAARGAALLELLHVAPDSPLASRKVRNGFQHIDSRIEEWALQDGWPSYADRTILSQSVLDELHLPASAFMRNIDPETSVVSFGTEQLNLGEIHEALSELAEAAHDAFS
jgi:hypothetical protein